MRSRTASSESSELIAIPVSRSVLRRGVSWVCTRPSSQTPFAVSPRLGCRRPRAAVDTDARVDRHAAVGTGENGVEVELDDLRDVDRETGQTMKEPGERGAARGRRAAPAVDEASDLAR